MRFGTCVGFDKLESAAKLGYDYLESNLGHIKSLSEQELKNTKAMLDGYGAKLEAVNCFFPGDTPRRRGCGHRNHKRLHAPRV